MNKRSLFFLLLAGLVTVTWFSCKKADKDKTQLGPTTEYYPLQIGKYVIYDVDSTLWDDTDCVTRTYHYQIMHRVADTFTDGLGRLSYRIDTRKRKKAEDTWTTSEVFYVTNTDAELEMVHSGLRFIKMKLPVTISDKWKGNAYINTDDSALSYFKDWDYQYTSVNAPFDNGRYTFQNTVSVLQVDETLNNPETQPKDFASRSYGKEVFASGIGMVYREYYHWIYNPRIIENNDPNNNVRCRFGAGVVMRAIDHN